MVVAHSGGGGLEIMESVSTSNECNKGDERNNGNGGRGLGK